MNLQDNQRLRIVVRALMFYQDHLLLTQWRDVVFLIVEKLDPGRSECLVNNWPAT